MNHFLIITSFLFLSTLSFSQKDWSLTKEQGDIKIFTKQSESGFKSFRGITTLNSNYKDVVVLNMLLDITRHWNEHSTEYIIFDQKAPNHRFEYTVNELPFPVTDRDIAIEIKLEIDTLNKVAKKIITSATDKYPLNDDYIRIEKINGFLEFKQITENQTQITYELTTDPNGSLPSWLVNMRITEEPLSTLKKMKEDISKLTSEQKASFNSYLK